MVTATVDNHGVENLRRMRSVQRATCACCVVKKTEYVTVAAHKEGFRLQRESNLKSGCILVIIRMLRDTWSRMAALSAGAAGRKLLRGAATDPIYLLSLYDHHPQLFMQGKLTLSLCA